MSQDCGEFGGGGHPRAAGARIRGNFEEVRSKVLKRVFHEIANPYDGVLLIDKASAMTAHDVVAIVPNRLATQKVGHCGTLDPFARVCSWSLSEEAPKSRIYDERG